MLMRRSEFVFDSVQLMYYKYHKVNFRCDGSCTDSPYCMKKKKKKQIQKMKMTKVFNMQ